MTLPKIATPTFELIQPSTKKKLQYRPFLVREEKVLLVAKESGEQRDIFNAMKTIIQSCVLTEGFNVNEIPLFDMDYIFLKIRSKSVSNIVKFNVVDSDDKKKYDLQLDLEEVEVNFPKELDTKIMISDKMGINMKYLTPEVTDLLKDDMSETDIVFTSIDHSIDYVFDEEEVYPWKEYSKKDKQEFIDSLPIAAFNKIQEFLEQTPSLEHVVKYTNSKGVEKRVVFRSLDDFFTFY